MPMVSGERSSSTSINSLGNGHLGARLAGGSCKEDFFRLVGGTCCKHNVSMPHVLVRDVPDDVHAALQRKAALHHQSLQQYLALELRHLAGRRSISEVLDEVEAQHGGRVGLPVAVTDLDEERAQR